MKILTLSEQPSQAMPLETSVLKVEAPATVAGHSLADLPTYVKQCTEMDGETVGGYFERNWKLTAGNAQGMAYLAKEMKRKFSLLGRKKVNGRRKTIRGFTSFEEWFTHATGKSVRLAYYLLETEEQKHQRNAERRAKEKKSAKQGPPPEGTTRPKPNQSLPTSPTANTADWTDNEYIKLCVQFVQSTLRPLEPAPQRFVRVAAAIAAEIVEGMENDLGNDTVESTPELVVAQ
jgi:hypothetical protein